jgi:hypothetical protein
VNGNEADMGGVLDRLLLQRDLVMRVDRLRGVVDRLHIFQAVIEAIEVVGCAAGASALRESADTHGRDEYDEAARFQVESSVDSHGIAPWFRALINEPVTPLR